MIKVEKLRSREFLEQKMEEFLNSGKVGEVISINIVLTGYVKEAYITYKEKENFGESKKD